MATYVQELHNKSTGDTIYPVTKTQAVYRADDTTTVEGSLTSAENRLDGIDDRIDGVEAATPVTLTANTTYVGNFNDNNKAYIVNGVCYLSINLQLKSGSIPSSGVILSGLPAPLGGAEWGCSANSSTTGEPAGRLKINQNGQLILDGAATLSGNKYINGSVAYPIATP